MTNKNFLKCKTLGQRRNFPQSRSLLKSLFLKFVLGCLSPIFCFLQNCPFQSIPDRTLHIKRPEERGFRISRRIRVFFTVFLFLSLQIFYVTIKSYSRGPLPVVLQLYCITQTTVFFCNKPSYDILLLAEHLLKGLWSGKFFFQTNFPLHNPFKWPDF